MGTLLRLCTAGSVDDGKSTLIGRLLYESQAVYEDQVLSVKAASRNRGVGPIDFSLFTDGLRAEREQGITIDVAYRYFATARRKFILADTPGHEQYTRNMATGASTAELAIVLVDARHGVREQTRRHVRIAELLGISSFVLAVNKMDLVDFDRGVFERIGEDFSKLVSDATLVHAIPLSALHGDNIVGPSDRTPWFDSAPLLEHLETVEVRDGLASAPFRMPVQLVVRPDQDFRGYAGRIASGTIRRGDRITVWPSGLSTRVSRIVTWEGDLDTAFAPMSITLTFEDDIDVSRGDILASGPLQVGRSVEATVVWMDERPMDPSRVYLLKHATRAVTAEVNASLRLNEIGVVTVNAARPLVFDSYAGNRSTGSFLLIDPATNATAGAGLIVRAANERHSSVHRSDAASRIALAARSASSEDDAVDAVRRVLEEILT
ncbi:MAG: GTP-binding protein [Vicinamibacterales bacterium]